MMRFFWVAFWAILYTDVTCADDVYNVMPLESIHLNTHVGKNHSITIPPLVFIVPVDCFLETPDGKVIPIDDEFYYPGFEIFSGSQVDCGLNVVITKELAGTWTLFARSSVFNEPTERRLPFTINIEEDEESGEVENIPELVPESSEEEEEEEELDNTVWLPQINRVTRTGQYIDITLNKIEHTELCSFVTPSGELSGDNEIPGVTMQESSHYVSCRITIGPMEASLLGDWKLCGKYVTDEEHKRCQPVSISWNTPNNPNSTWQTNEQRLFNHSVSFDGYLRPVIVGSGTTLTCHIITPKGEDLVLKPDLEYPKIQRTAMTTASTCAVSIGPIEDWMLGSWTLYGQFRSALWFNEVRMPMNMFLYDEENPYDQPYNVTNLDPFIRVINLDTTTTVEVTGSGNIDSCQYRAPNGQLYESYASHQFPGVTAVDVGSSVVCRISIGPIDKNMLGEWELIGKFSNNGIFTERRQIFDIIQEDPENPIIEDRIIQNLTELFFDTRIGENQIITIARTTLINPQSCHIRTPSGRQYTIMDGFNVLGVTVLNGTDVECGVNINVHSEDMVGEWTLIARSTMSSDALERRLRFVIYVEEQVEAFPKEIVITEGNDLHVRLKNPTDQYETCKLVAPPEASDSTHDIEAIHNPACDFVVNTIEKSDEGLWEIVYGAKIVYRATVNVTVKARETPAVSNQVFVKDRAVNEIIGPENAVYCILKDPSGRTVFDSFGRCILSIDRVTMDHSGDWLMMVGFPGRVTIDEHVFKVTVTEAEPKAVVTTKVQRQQPSVVLSCSVSSAHNVRACKFRSPRGNILLATQGVGEDRYVFYGSKVSSEVHSHECGIRITNPSEEDLGMWRCAIETEGDTYYGFLTVVFPWLMQDPEIQTSVITEPVLKASQSSVSTVEGESLTMSCSIQSAIRYCYFRSGNGTVYSVKPATSTSLMEYVGNGFDAGECGVRMRGLMSRDSGRWSCHVGLYNETEEKRDPFEVTVKAPMTVRQYMHQHHGLVVEAMVAANRSLEYCRFVRIDGFGFTTDSIPSGYKFLGSLDVGHCLLHIEEPIMLNLHPWTIVVQIRGQDEELSRQTTDNLLWFYPEFAGRPISIYLWLIVIFVGLTLLLVGVTLGPEKNRQWTIERASQIRSSLRNSFRKPKQIQNP